MDYPTPYLSFLVHFHGDRDYFECHEILEEYWKKTVPRERDSHWVGLIQIAVSFYHYRRGNISGAIRMLTKSLSILSKKRLELNQLGLNIDELLVLLHQQRERMIAHKPYENINLPLMDEYLIKQCIGLCDKAGFIWCSHTSLDNRYIIDKHLVRDRTDIIQERKRQLEIRLH